jgi:hypothetical protein
MPFPWEQQATPDDATAAPSAPSIPFPYDVPPPPARPASDLPGVVQPGAQGVLVPPESRVPQVIGGGLTRGLTMGTVGLPGDLAQLAASGTNTPGLRPSWLPTSPQAIGWEERNLPSLVTARPQTPGERVLAAGAEGVGAAAPLALAGGAPAAIGAARAGESAIPPLARSLVGGVEQGAASGAGGELGGQTLGPPGRALGTIAGLGLGSVGLGSIGRTIGAVTGAEDPTVQAYRALGITPRLAGDVTGSPTLQKLQQTAVRMPGGGRIEDAARQTIDEFGNAVENTANKFGPEKSLQQSGVGLQSDGYRWYGDFRTAQQNAENAVAAEIPAGTRAQMGGVSNALDATSKLPNVPNVAQVMQDPVFQRLQSALQKDMPSAGANAGTLPWSDVRAWRTMVGEKLDDAALSGDTSQTAWRNLYGALSQTLGDTATGLGGKAEAAWAKANQVTRDGAAFRDGTLNNIINSRNPAQNTIRPEDAGSWALSAQKKGGSVLQDIRDQMPAGADALAGYSLRNMARAVPSAQLAAGDAISPGSFLTRYNQMAPEARDALFPANHPAAGDIANLNTVSGSMKDTAQKLANPSGTGAAVGHTLPWLLVPEGASKGYEFGSQFGPVGGTVGAAAGAVAPFVPGWAGGQLLSRPSLTAALAQPNVLAAPRLASRLGLAGALIPQLPLRPGETGR